MFNTTTTISTPVATILEHLGLCKFETGYTKLKDAPTNYKSESKRNAEKSFIHSIENGYVRIDVVQVDPRCPDRILHIVSNDDPDVHIFSDAITSWSYSIGEYGDYYRYETRNGTVWNIWVPLFEDMDAFGNIDC